MRHFAKKTQKNVQQQKPPEQKYDYRSDPRIRSVLKNVALLFLIIYASGKLTYFIINRYVMDSAED